VQVVFDPAVIGYERLLEIFWDGVEPTHMVMGRQYANNIFYHSDEQRRQAEESKQRLAEKLKQSVFADIIPFLHFYPAEDYHQKYYLQQSRELMGILKEIYPNFQDLIKSTAAGRLNGYRGGYLTQPRLRVELAKIEEAAPFSDRILDAARGAGVLSAH
jgi:peptide-methionine (S)-S-oxide reductase